MELCRRPLNLTILSPHAPDTSIRLSPQVVEKDVLYRTFHNAKRQGNFDNKALAIGEDLLDSRRQKTAARLTVKATSEGLTKCHCIYRKMIRAIES